MSRKIFVVFLLLFLTPLSAQSSESKYDDTFIDACLSFAFQRHLSGNIDQWDALSIDYESALSSEIFPDLARLLGKTDCLISPDKPSFDKSNGFLWTLAIHSNKSKKSEFLKQLDFGLINKGSVFLLGYLVATDESEDSVTLDNVKTHLKKLAQSNPNAGIKGLLVIDDLSTEEGEKLLLTAKNLGSQKAYLWEANEGELRSRLSEKSFLDSLSSEERAIYFYYACSRLLFEGVNDETKVCENHINEPLLALYKTFDILNKPYAKKDVITAKNLLFKLLENPHRLAVDWLDQFTLNEQASILMFQLFAHFGGDRSIFTEEDVSRYLGLASKNLIPIHEVSIGYFLASLYRTYSIYDMEDDVRSKYNKIYKILRSSKASLFEFCKKEQKLKFSSNNRWPSGPMLPIISSFNIYDIEFLELESAADDEGRLRVYGSWHQLDLGFFEPDAAETEDYCRVDFMESGNPVFPSYQQVDSENSITQREFTSEIFNREAVSPIQLSQSELLGHPWGEVSWEFDVNQIIKLDTDLTNFPFSTKRTPISFSFYSRTSHFSAPALFSDMEMSEAGRKINEDDGNIFFARSTKDAKDDINLEVNLNVNLTYYVLRVIAPVLIFVSLGLFTLLKARENTEAQLQVATTVMVALVAYQFVINSTLPKLSYLTLIDWFLLASVASSAFIILFNLVPHLEKKDTKISQYLFLGSRIGGVGGYLFSTIILLYGLWLHSQT